MSDHAPIDTIPHACSQVLERRCMVSHSGSSDSVSDTDTGADIEKEETERQ